jgi:hypothetical protein
MRADAPRRYSGIFIPAAYVLAGHEVVKSSANSAANPSLRDVGEGIFR